MIRNFTLALAFGTLFALPALAQDSNHHLDVSTNSGNLHIGDDADAKKAGLPLYPGAHLKSDKESKNEANLSILTDAFGMKLIVANYESDDAPAKVIDFYREKLKKYGKVLECHTQKHGGDVDIHDGDDSKDNQSKDTKDKELKCEQDSGPVTELKVGTENNQHVVAVEPRDASKGTTFALVYVYTRGKRGEI